MNVLLAPASEATSGTTSMSHAGIDLPMVIPGLFQAQGIQYFRFLVTYCSQPTSTYVLGTASTETPPTGGSERSAVRRLMGVDVEIAEARAGLRNLTDLLRQRLVPPASAQARMLAERAIEQQEDTNRADVDAWARRLAEDVADADD